jgi:hypothetical protein
MMYTCGRLWVKASATRRPHLSLSGHTRPASLLTQGCLACYYSCGYSSPGGVLTAFMAAKATSANIIPAYRTILRELYKSVRILADIPVFVHS